jgi:hypothetical protein
MDNGGKRREVKNRRIRGERKRTRMKMVEQEGKEPREK